MSVSRGKIVDSVKSGKLNGEVVGKEKVSCGNVGDDDAKDCGCGQGCPPCPGTRRVGWVYRGTIAPAVSSLEDFHSSSEPFEYRGRFMNWPKLRLSHVISRSTVFRIVPCRVCLKNPSYLHANGLKGEEIHEIFRLVN